jgi:NADPH:quinone reductase-like Zn-dependent oxidoreductase
MSSIPKTIKAVTATGNRTVKVTEVLAPSLDGHPDDIIIKNYACAQNPTDWKSVAQGRTQEGRIVGNDIAGVVVALGDNVTNVKVGERVSPQLMNL